MKNIYLTLALLSIFLASCNRDYYEDNYDIPTESIRFKELSVSNIASDQKTLSLNIQKKK